MERYDENGQFERDEPEQPTFEEISDPNDNVPVHDLNDSPPIRESAEGQMAVLEYELDPNSNLAEDRQTETQLISETHSSEHISHARVQGFHGNLAIAIQETGQMANEQPPYYVQNLNANPQFEEDFGGGIIVVLEFGAGQLKLMIINSIPAIVEEL